MKALSVRQPRAEQIIRGSKTMDVRTWQVRYRGPLAIHASSTKRVGRIRALGFDPDSLPYGALVGVVELVEIVELDETTFDATREAHQGNDTFPGFPCYGWRFANPHRLAEPLPTRGAMSLFEVPDDPLLDADEQAKKTSPAAPTIERPQPQRNPRIPYESRQAPTPDPEHPFVLYALPEKEGGYRVALYQWLQSNGSTDRAERAPGAMWNIEVGRDVVRAAADQLLRALRANEYKPTVLANQPNTPLYLDEASGVRLALTFMAIKPLSRYNRIEAIIPGILHMSDEEAYYWFSKCSVGANATRAQKALRVLLSDE